MKSKRFEALSNRPINQDGFVTEWVEEGLIAMESPNDPKPSIKIVNGTVVELDGKPKEEFDLIDQFIANYGIDLTRAEEVVKMD
ncbi:propanediol/glycerol family dehydratase large subunit, partial [Streptococcus suis]